MKKPTIAFIGAGNMASSLIGGLIADSYPPNCIFATNPIQEKLASLEKSFGINTTSNNREGAEKADIIVFSVKPNLLKSVVVELKETIRRKNPLLISVAVGITTETIQKWLVDIPASIVRCMPNTPALLRCGATALYANSRTSEEQSALAESILRAVGVTVWVTHEREMDVVTAISGSGPAYFFLVMEAIMECAQEMGLKKEQAQLLTVNTALGAARMALESNKDIGELRQQVTSPGGTTEQAIQVLESGGVRTLFNNALCAARDKAISMAHLFEEK